MNAAVIGGGTMGAGIAAVLARAGIDVGVVDVNADAGRAAANAGRAVLADLRRRGKLTAVEEQIAAGRVTAVEGCIADLPDGLELIIEAVPERFELKRAVLAEADARQPVLLASNTSALSITDLAAGLARPARFLGLHFFNPVPVMRLVEVVLSEQTASTTVEHAASLVGRLGKESIIVRDSPGFATSRLGVALGLEAIRMVEEGVAGAQDIDRAMVLGYGHSIGPLRVTDIVGLDVRLDIADSLSAVFGPRFAAPELMRTMVREGRLGRKTGSGFYDWSAVQT
jgi:3-hydroxybutyryl-CoA dehydrogenase